MPSNQHIIGSIKGALVQSCTDIPGSSSAARMTEALAGPIADGL